MNRPEDIGAEMYPGPNKQRSDEAFPILELDPEDYREQMGEMDFTPEQAQEFLTTLWNIMSTMVDIGWGVDTVQMFLPDIFENTGPDSDNSVKRKDSLQLFNNAAKTPTERDRNND